MENNENNVTNNSVTTDSAVTQQPVAPTVAETPTVETPVSVATATSTPEQPAPKKKKKKNLLIALLVCAIILVGFGVAFANDIIPNPFASESSDDDDDDDDNDNDKSDDSDEAKTDKTDKEVLLEAIHTFDEDMEFYANGMSEYLGLEEYEQASKTKSVQNTAEAGATVNTDDTDHTIKLNLDTLTNTTDVSGLFAVDVAMDNITIPVGQLYVSQEKLALQSNLISTDKVFSIKLDGIANQLRNSIYAESLGEEFFTTLDQLTATMSDDLFTNLPEFDETFISDFQTAYTDDIQALYDAITVTANGDVYTVVIPKKETLRVIGDFINYVVNHEDVTAYVSAIMQYVYENDSDLATQYATFDEFFEGTYGTVQKSINLVTGTLGTYWKDDITFDVTITDGEITKIAYEKEITYDGGINDADSYIIDSVDEADSIDTTDSDNDADSDIATSSASTNTTINLAFDITCEEPDDSSKKITYDFSATEKSSGETIKLTVDSTYVNSTEKLSGELSMTMVVPDETGLPSMSYDWEVNKTSGMFTMNMEMTADGSSYGLVCDNGTLTAEKGKSITAQLPVKITQDDSPILEFYVNNTSVISDTTPYVPAGTEYDLLALTETDLSNIMVEAYTNLSRYGLITE